MPQWRHFSRRKWKFYIFGPGLKVPSQKNALNNFPLCSCSWQCGTESSSDNCRHMNYDWAISTLLWAFSFPSYLENASQNHCNHLFKYSKSIYFGGQQRMLFAALRTTPHVPPPSVSRRRDSLLLRLRCSSFGCFIKHLSVFVSSVWNYGVTSGHKVSGNQRGETKLYILAWNSDPVWQFGAL